MGGLSLIVPFYNEATTMRGFFDRVLPVLAVLRISYEIVCIDDGSTDDTLDQLLALRQREPAIKILSLSRNFGKDVALTAGIDHCNGAAVVAIDADLQDPPEIIVDLLAKWKEGCDVVYAQRRSRGGDSWGRRLSAKLFYIVMDSVSDVQIPSGTGDFCLLDRKVARSLRRFPERNRFMKGLIAWAGFRQGIVPYDRPGRSAGKSKWNYLRLWRFALGGIFSFSSLPLRLPAILGAGFCVVATLYWILDALSVTTPTTVGLTRPDFSAAILFVAGIQLIALGIVGKYLALIFEDVKRRPLYLLSGRWGFEADREPNAMGRIADP